MIKSRDALCHAGRVVHRGGDVVDRVTYVDLLRARRDVGEKNLRRRLMRVILEEVMLRRPVVLESDVIDLLVDEVHAGATFRLAIGERPETRHQSSILRKQRPVAIHNAIGRLVAKFLAIETVCR